jgi:hypothetical protein
MTTTSATEAVLDAEAQEIKMPKGYSGHKVACHEMYLYDSHVEVVLPNGMKKAIGLGDFIAILTKTANEESSIRTLLLPAGCYVFGQTITEIKLACYYPGKVRVVDFQDKESKGISKYSIPFPNVIISHKLIKPW